MDEFNYETYCKDKLESILPGFQKKWEQQANLPVIQEVDAYMLYERALLDDYVFEAIRRMDKSDKRNLYNIFNLIEELIQHPNFNVQCLAEVGFIEPFVATLEPKRDVEKYLRPKSLETARALARKWFKINPETWEETT